VGIRKRWRRWPQSRRTRALVVAGVVGIVTLLVLAVFVLPPVMVSTTDVPDTVERLEAQNAIRTALIQALGGLVLLGGAALTATFSARTIRLNREGQITDRFTKAIDQLGDQRLDVKLGGIYALERIAQESPRDHWPIVEVLTAFLREHFPASDPEPSNAARDQGQGDRPSAQVRRPPADAQAALTVLGRRTGRIEEPGRLDLSRIDLPGANLSEAHLEGATLRGAHLERARLVQAHL
jgi:hypothetical protein